MTAMSLALKESVMVVLIPSTLLLLATAPVLKLAILGLAQVKVGEISAVKPLKTAVRTVSRADVLARLIAFSLKTKDQVLAKAGRTTAARTVLTAAIAASRVDALASLILSSPRVLV
jgi:hypothetical protein